MDTLDYSVHQLRRRLLPFLSFSSLPPVSPMSISTALGPPLSVPFNLIYVQQGPMNVFVYEGKRDHRILSLFSSPRKSVSASGRADARPDGILVNLVSFLFS